MAELPKNDPISGGASSTLYYFPEIPSGIEKKAMAGNSHASFVSGAPRQNNDFGHLSQSASRETPDASLMVEEAFAKGLEQGRSETGAVLQEKVETAVSAFNTAVRSMIQAHQQNIQRMEMETVRLALFIAKKVIGRECEAAHVIQHVIKQALEKVADPRHLILRLHPEDIETVESVKAELVEADDGDVTLRIQPDGAIQKGGCVIETQLGDIDARIDQQLKIIESLLTEQLTNPATQD
ncbi:FliH/SctL family protein [Desulfosarcina cetonica]